MKVIDGHMTSPCNVASLTRGDLVIGATGQRFEILNVSLARPLARVTYRVFGESGSGSVGRWRKNDPMNRIVGARAGGNR